MKLKLTSPWLIFSAFVCFSLGLTFPLILSPFTHIPQGSEPVGTVPLFNLWTLQWNIDQMLAGYPNYWNAPIFAPLQGTFAFSETQPLSALLATPVWLGFQSPALAYNFVIWAFLSLNGWFAYWLMRGWGVSTFAAFGTGLLMQALPFVAQEMGVLQLIALFGILWSLRFLQQWSTCPTNRNRAMIGVALGTPITFFTCGYYGLFSLFFLPLALLTQTQKRRIAPQFFVHLLVISLLTILLTGPFLWSQQQQLANFGFNRSPQTIENNSAKPIFYTYTLDYNLIYGQLFGREPQPGQRLFPGLGLLFLAGLGLFGIRGYRAKIYLILAISLALLLSFGLRFEIGEIQPYQWTRDYVPGFAQLRSPFRFAVFAQLHLVLLAGFGLHNLNQWPGVRHSPMFLFLLGFGIIEALALPLPLHPVAQTRVPQAWQVWLNEESPEARIVMLPFAPESGVAHFEQTTRWMLTNHHLTGAMVNGYSGFFPPDHRQLRAQMLAFPSKESIEFLRRKAINFVVIDETALSAPSSLDVNIFLRQVYEDKQNQISVYQVDSK